MINWRDYPALLLILACGLLPPNLFAEPINPFAMPAEHMAAEGHGSTSQVAPLEFKLKAIMPSKTRPLANVNGQVLAIGDVYFGYRLDQVSDNGVRLISIDGAKSTINLTLHNQSQLGTPDSPNQLANVRQGPSLE